MRTGSSPSVPVVSGRSRSAWLTGAALGAILALAAWTRFRWPGAPVVDADSWGYLHPALAKLTGQGFVHTNGRNFVYPGFLYLALAATGSFRAITLGQHLLGLAGGVMMWTCWRQWRGWFAESRLPGWADAGLGLGLVAFFLQSASEVSYEHQVRPEAVFPFFALADLSLLMAFARAWWVERRPGRAAALAGGGVFGALLLYQLKPSFGFGLAAALVPVLAALLLPWRQPGMARARAGLAAAVGAAVAVGALVFIWPEHRLAQGDAMSTLFLPETLLTIHADIIRDQIDADLRGHAATPYAPDWLAQASADLGPELRHASLPEYDKYPTLGFNPDYLMYRDSFCFWLRTRLTPGEVAGFAFYYYRRAWTHQPGRMLGKVGRQLRAFYSLHGTTFWPGAELAASKQYRKGVEAFRYPGYQRELAHYPPARAYMAEIARLGGGGLVFRQPALMVYANTAMSVAAFPLMLLFLTELAVVGCVRAGLFEAPAVGRLLAPGWVLLGVYGWLFAIVLTIAIVHSVDVDRYCLNLLVYYALGSAGTAAWLAEFVLALGHRGETPPGSAAD